MDATTKAEMVRELVAERVTSTTSRGFAKVSARMLLGSLDAVVDRLAGCGLDEVVVALEVLERETEQAEVDFEKDAREGAGIGWEDSFEKGMMDAKEAMLNNAVLAFDRELAQVRSWAEAGRVEDQQGLDEGGL